MRTLFICLFLFPSCSSLIIRSSFPEKQGNLHQKQTGRDSLNSVLERGDVPVLRSDESDMFFDAMNKRHDQQLERIPVPYVNCRPTKLLVIIYGLLRTYESTWSILKKQLNVAGLSECAGHVHVLLNTNLQKDCSDKDRQMSRECPPSKDQLAKIKKTYGVHLKGIFHDTNDSMSGGVMNTIGRRITDSVTEYKNQTDSETSYLERLFNPASRGSSEVFLKTYTHVMAIRTDGHLAIGDNQGKFDQNGHLQVGHQKESMDMSSICEKYPGFNIIHGDYFVKSWIHNRDFDKGFLACEPHTLLKFFAPEASCLTLKDADVPPVPKDFGKSWSNYHYYSAESRPTHTVDCNRLLEFAHLGVRLGTLDNEEIFVKLFGRDY